MNCQEFHELAQALARDENLDPVIVEDALGHADSCETCDALLEECEGITTQLRALAASHANEAAPARVEEALLRAFRQQRQPEVNRLPGVRWQGMGIVAVAAVILLVLSVTGLPKGLWHPAWIARLGQTSHAPIASGTSPSAQQTQATAASDDQEATASFVPLSGTFDLSSLNEDPIVRVVLSSEQLESLGVPVGDSDDDQVVADLIIANDGTPQAIRVVSW